MSEAEIATDGQMKALNNHLEDIGVATRLTKYKTYPRESIIKLIAMAENNERDDARMLLESTIDRLERNKMELWKLSLNNDILKKISSDITYKNLNQEIEERIVESVKNRKAVDEIIFENYHNDYGIEETAIYPFSGVWRLPNYVFGNAKRIMYIDQIFVEDNPPRKYVDNNIEPVCFDLVNGLPDEAKKDLELCILRRSTTRKYEKMHNDIKDNIKTNGLVAVYEEFPHEHRRLIVEGKKYSTLPYWLYQLNGYENGLGSYTVPLDYSLTEESCDELSQISNRKVDKLSDLTYWSFFEANPI